MRAVAWSVVLLLAGCGPGAHSRETLSPKDEPQGSVEDYEQRIERMQRELLVALDAEPASQLGQEPQAGVPVEELDHEYEPVSTGPDCGAAADLRDRICELARRICELAGRNASDPSLATTCEKARKACDRASADVSERCD
jgi:hypothetical protein